MRKLSVLLLAGLLIGGTAQAAQASSFSVSVTASRTTVELGGTFTLSGKVSPKAKGRTVKIQRRLAGGSWKTIKNVKLSSHSTYAYTVMPTTGGTTEYRVSKARSGKRHSKVSRTRVVDVLRWRPLSDFTVTAPVGSSVTYGTRGIGGQAFAGSAAIGIMQNSEATWTFGGARCDTFRTFIGIDDQSTAGKKASPNIYWNKGLTGETQIQKGAENAELTIGQNPRSFSAVIPAGTSTLYVNTVFDTNTPGYVTLGTPQLHCDS